MTPLETALAELADANIRVREALYWRNHYTALRTQEHNRVALPDAWTEADRQLHSPTVQRVPEVRGCPREPEDAFREYNIADFDLQRERYQRTLIRKKVRDLKA